VSAEILLHWGKIFVYNDFCEIEKAIKIFTKISSAEIKFDLPKKLMSKKLLCRIV